VTSVVAVVTVQSPPNIFEAGQPQPQAVIQGSNATFSVTAVGDQPFTYQWRYLGTNLPGATANPLVLTGVQTNQAGNYSVVVSNPFGSATSSNALLTVRVPPFIVTLAMMLVASGAAYLLTHGQSVYQVPDSFVWLGRGTNWFGLPNAVLLMALLYIVAHLVMSRTVLGRWIYAVGGNRQAARFSGVPVRRVLFLSYVVSGLLAGLGGVVLASQLKSGSPTFGQMYELYVIAAVVVGGASLNGGTAAWSTAKQRVLACSTPGWVATAGSNIRPNMALSVFE